MVREHEAGPLALAPSPAPTSLLPIQKPLLLRGSGTGAEEIGVLDARPPSAPSLLQPLGWPRTTCSTHCNAFTALLAQETLVGKQGLRVPRAKPLGLSSSARLRHRGRFQGELEAVYTPGSSCQRAWAGTGGDRDPASLGGRARRESPSLEPAGAEATSAAAGGRQRGHLTEQVAGLAGSQVLALGGWPHRLQAGTSNALTAWLARRRTCPRRERGPRVEGRTGYKKLIPRSRFPRPLRAGCGLLGGP